MTSGAYGKLVIKIIMISLALLGLVGLWQLFVVSWNEVMPKLFLPSLTVLEAARLVFVIWYLRVFTDLRYLVWLVEFTKDEKETAA